MRTPARFVVVDDRPDHLKAILDAFQSIGTPCLGVVYDPATELDTTLFAGVRALFLDLHLLSGIVSTDHKTHFANILNILETHISALGGPFVLVIWTQHAHLKSELIAYLEQNLDPERPHARPLAVLSIAKEQFIDVATGNGRKGVDLVRIVREAVPSTPQLNALLSWEADVIAAAGATLSALLGLVPLDQRASTAHPQALDGILSRLAREAVGRSNVAVDPRSAITTILGPILADRVVNQQPGPDAEDLWSKAVTRHDDRTLGDATTEEAGQINRMLHVAMPPSETIRPTDWGAVVELPGEFRGPAAFRKLLGVTEDELLGGEFKVERAHRSRCLKRLVRVGAVCDHAQNRRGPISFQFGLEIPHDAMRMTDGSGQFRAPAAEWSSPTLLTESGAGAFKLVVNTRYTVSFTREAAQGWKSVYRLREQLLMHLIAHWNGYTARPGIIKL